MPAALSLPQLVNRIRLATGLVLFAYATTHLLNHSLGLISLDAMDAGAAHFRRAVVQPDRPDAALWQPDHPSGAGVLVDLPAAQPAHARCGKRHSFARAADPAAAGDSHHRFPRLAHQLYGTDDNYIYELLVLWVFSPKDGVQQAVVLVIAGCMAASACISGCG